MQNEMLSIYLVYFAASVVVYSCVDSLPVSILDDFGLELTRPEFYYYLNQTGVYTVEGTNDAEDYNDLKVMVYRIDQLKNN